MSTTFIRNADVATSLQAQTRYKWLWNGSGQRCEFRSFSGEMAVHSAVDKPRSPVDNKCFSTSLVTMRTGSFGGMLRALLPLDKNATPVNLEEFYAVPRRGANGRPQVGLCMIASLDGSTSLDGTSGAMGSDTDRAVLRTLRAAADVIVVGATTVNAEGYRAPKKPGQRIGVVTRSCNLDFNSELFTSGAGFVITCESAPEVPVESLRKGRDALDLHRAISALDADFVQLEGGPTLNAAMFEADLVDEINLTIAPLLLGGSGVRLVQDMNEKMSRWQVAHLLEENGYFYTRYLRAQ